MPNETLDRTAQRESTQLDRVPGRTPRLLSLEQEVGTGGEYAANTFHDHGYSAFEGMIGYHSGARHAPQGFCYVEDDASCGGEIIYSRLALHTPSVASRLDECLELLDGLRDEGYVSFSSSAGFHVHVGLDRPTLYTARQASSLYHLFNHLEDALYRIAAAGWARHRIEGSSPYAPVNPKGHVRTADALDAMSRNRGGLNLQNYLSARSMCRCGGPHASRLTPPGGLPVKLCKRTFSDRFAFPV